MSRAGRALALLGTDAASKNVLSQLRAQDHEGDETASAQTGEASNASRHPGKVVSAEVVVQGIAIAASTKVQRAHGGPLQTIDDLSQGNHECNILFVSKARLEAICGNMSTIKEAATAIGCWKKFVEKIDIAAPDEEVPSSVTGLLSCSRIVRSKGTYANYMGKLALACEIGGVSRKSFAHPSVKRAKATVGSLEGPPKPKLGIRTQLLETLVSASALEGDLLPVLLYIVSYSFLLRVPSEALTMEVSGPHKLGSPMDDKSQSRLIWTENAVHLHLKRRKNRKQGSRIVRKCWCEQSPTTCPVHALKDIVGCMHDGHKPFEKVPSHKVLALLRHRMRKLGMPMSEAYETKDFRRGHARDLIEKPGGTLKEVMAMGQWKSSALIDYLDINEIEAGAVIEAHIAESETEDEDD